MRDDSPVIVLPGYEDSGPDHWQTRWCAAHPEYHRITGLDWTFPERDAWVAALDASVRAAPAPPIIVAHSLGAVTVATWADGGGRGARAALLVAPCDSEQTDFPDAIHGFAPMPASTLPFPSTLVASRTDPWTRFERARRMAAAWGSRLVDLGDAGHVNTAAGYGPWAEGERLLADLLAGGDRS